MKLITNKENSLLKTKKRKEIIIMLNISKPLFRFFHFCISTLKEVKIWVSKNH